MTLRQEMTAERDKVLFWSGGRKSTALALLMMDAGEEFDIFFFRRHYEDGKSMVVPQQEEWENKMIKVFEDYGCHVIIKYTKPVKGATHSERKIIGRAKKSSAMVGHPYGAVIFDLYQNQCRYRIRYRRDLNKLIIRYFLKEGHQCYFGHLLEDSREWVDLRCNNPAMNVLKVFPFRYYGVNIDDIERTILSYGYDLPPMTSCICCPASDLEERNKIRQMDKDVMDKNYHILYDGNPTWIEDKVAVKNGWYKEIFHIDELDYPRRKNKWLHSNPSVTLRGKEWNGGLKEE